jgi:hypothetical protein
MKWFKSKKQPSAFSRQEALTRVPIKNPLVRESRLESGVVLLTYPQPLRPFVAALSRRIGGSAGVNPERKLELDDLGTQVWDMIDNRRPVERLVRRFAERHRLPPREAEVSVTQFLRELGRRGIIGLR